MANEGLAARRARHQYTVGGDQEARCIVCGVFWPCDAAVAFAALEAADKAWAEDVAGLKHVIETAQEWVDELERERDGERQARQAAERRASLAEAALEAAEADRDRLQEIVDVAEGRAMHAYSATRQVTHCGCAICGEEQQARQAAEAAARVAEQHNMAAWQAESAHLQAVIRHNWTPRAEQAEAESARLRAALTKVLRAFRWRQGGGQTTNNGYYLAGLSGEQMAEYEEALRAPRAAERPAAC